MTAFLRRLEAMIIAGSDEGPDGPFKWVILGACAALLGLIFAGVIR